MNISPLVVFHTHDYCFNCNTRSIVGITENGDEISIDNEYEINRNVLVKLRCKKCKKESMIDWRYDKKPKPFYV